MLHALYLINTELFMNIKLSATKYSGKSIVHLGQELSFKYCVFGNLFCSLVFITLFIQSIGLSNEEHSEQAWLS